MNLEVFAASDVGKSRQNNEDNFYVCGLNPSSSEKKHVSFSKIISDENMLFAVCDGMGGEENGELASEAAINALRIQKNLDLIPEGRENTTAANQAVLDMQEANHCPNSGTTLAAIAFKGSRCVAYNVGDSRVYRLHGNKLEKLTQDHSVVQRMVSLGIISEDEMDTYPGRSTLTHSLGTPTNGNSFAPYFSDVLEPGEKDRFLICSDGLYEGISKNTIQELLGAPASCESIGRSLMQAALTGTSMDNITAIVICVC